MQLPWTFRRNAPSYIEYLLTSTARQNNEKCGHMLFELLQGFSRLLDPIAFVALGLGAVHPLFYSRQLLSIDRHSVTPALGPWCLRCGPAQLRRARVSYSFASVIRSTHAPCGTSKSDF